ncbi:conjugal transfer protein TraF [Bdellovibrionota bacterium FG-1]
MWSRLATFVGLASLLTSASYADDEFQYFSKPDIDYWSRADQSTPPTPILPKVSRPAGVPTKGFAWDKYLNPAHDEFFREGDYTPPAPFVEIARNPTNENIERWYRYIELKNTTLHRLQERLTEYAQRNPSKVSALPSPYSTGLSDNPEMMAKVAARVEKPSAVAPDAKRFRLRLYFDSHCPHCQRMIGTMSELAARGYYVELRQIDQDRSIRARIPFPVTDASPEELKTYGIQAVPVLLVGDLKAKSFFKMQGYQPAPTVLAALSEKANTREIPPAPVQK